MQIKAIVRNHHTLVRLAKLTILSFVWIWSNWISHASGNAKWYRYSGKYLVGYFKTLQHEGYELERPAARRGVRNYKAQGRLEEEYDLSNWMWVCVKRNNVHFFISLQAFERDSKTGNFHVLTDRIGIYAYVGDFSPQDAQTKMLITLWIEYFRLSIVPSFGNPPDRNCRKMGQTKLSPHDSRNKAWFHWWRYRFLF